MTEQARSARKGLFVLLGGHLAWEPPDCEECDSPATHAVALTYAPGDCRGRQILLTCREHGRLALNSATLGFQRGQTCNDCGAALTGAKISTINTESRKA